MSVATETSFAHDSPPAAQPREGEFPYRSLSRTAVLSLVLGLLSTLALGFPSLAVLPVVGIVLGISAWRNIRRYPAELTGQGMAMMGVVLSAVFLVVGVSWHTYEFLTEVPEGYTRITFSDLQPNRENPGEQIPGKAFELNNQKVFIKGYVHPGISGSEKVKHFVLVSDMGTCCFGGQPKPTHMIEVFIKDGPGISWNTRVRKLSGTFGVAPPRNSLGLNSVVYAMEAEQLQ